MMADGYDERVKMTVSCSHAQPMPDTSDDARLAREAQASYHQPGPDTSQDARLARELATNCQYSDDVILHHGRCRVDIWAQAFCCSPPRAFLLQH